MTPLDTITPLPAHQGGSAAPCGVPGAPTIRTPLMLVEERGITLWERIHSDSESHGRRLVIFGGCEGVTSRESRAVALLLLNAADPDSGLVATKARLAVAERLMDAIVDLMPIDAWDACCCWRCADVFPLAEEWREIRAKGGE